MKPKAIYSLVAVVLITLVSWSQSSKSTKAAAPADWKDVDAAMGRAGQDQPDGTHKFSLPRKDMNVTVNGVQVKAGLALGSWVAFKAVSSGNAMAMGDWFLLKKKLRR